MKINNSEVSPRSDTRNEIASAQPRILSRSPLIHDLWLAALLLVGFAAFLFSSAVVSAANGPDPAGWIPGADLVASDAPLPGTRRQPGPYYARDVYKLFIPKVAGKDLRLTVTGESGVKVDYFDEQRDNGLYAIFGATTPGTMTLNYQWKPTSSGSWTTAKSVVVTVGAKRNLPYDAADIPINIWYTSDPTWPGDTERSNSKGPVLELKLHRDFADIAAHGFTAVTYVWQPIHDPQIVFSEATEHGLKVRYVLLNANGFVSSIPNQRNNVRLLDMEAKVKADVNRDLGGGALLKNSPALWGYYAKEETQSWAGVELTAMLAKAHDLNHETSTALALYHSANSASLTTNTPFLQFSTTETYPLTSSPSNKATGDFTNSSPFPFNNDGGTKYSVPDMLSWLQSKNTSRRVEDIVQGHKGQVYTSPAGTKYILRHPSAKELRAQVFMAAARGCGPISYFTYQSFGSITGMLDFDFNESAGLVESTSINAKLSGWMPIYKKLDISSTGSDPIAYVLNAPVVGNFVHQTTGERYLIVVNTDCTATRTVTVNGIKDKNGGTATKVKNVDSGAEISLSGGKLQMSLGAGDGALLLVNPGGGGAGGTSTLYSNNMESNTTFGGALTTSKAHGGTHSEKMGANGTFHTKTVSAALPAGDITSFVYGVWINDDNDSSQLYRIGFRFRKPDGSLSAFYESGWKSLGSGWGKISGDFVSTVNTVRDQGYTEIFQISLRAYRGSSYKTYYIDDLSVVADSTGGGGSNGGGDSGGGDSSAVYSNDMESNTTFGGALTTSKAHGGTHSEKMGANGTFHTKTVSAALPAGDITSFVYGVWIHDDNDSSQLYRIGFRFQKPDGSLSTFYESGWKSLGSGWGKISADFVGTVNTVRGQGYTKVFQISLRAYRSSSYKTYYIDDLSVVGD